MLVTYIRKLDENLSLLQKFADATKIGGIVDREEDCERKKHSVHQLEVRAVKLQVEFNPDKLEVMHFEGSNARGKYTVNGMIPLRHKRLESGEESKLREEHSRASSSYGGKRVVNHDCMRIERTE